MPVGRSILAICGCALPLLLTNGAHASSPLANAKATRRSGGAKAPPRRTRHPTLEVLPLGRVQQRFGPGFHRVRVQLPHFRYVSVGIFGPQDALHHFRLRGLAYQSPFRADGRLPKLVSFATADGVDSVELSFEVSAEVVLKRAVSPARHHAKGACLVGMPEPSTRASGYLLERPARYQFLHPLMVRELRRAFRRTRRTFRRDPIAILDASQWDSRRPALDLGHARHVTHRGGRDVDIALPSTIEPRMMGDHCTRAVSAAAKRAVCRPGTAEYVDSPRLAYVLGQLVATHKVSAIFTDEEYLAKIRAAAERLASHKLLRPAVAKQLQAEGGIMRHLPWHTDHVHIRFRLPSARDPFANPGCPAPR